mmetsp:Transcript_36879/g.68904  ORF Transcript_36879/g.68904 Transcript_36879/m.68904 type:complete len:611 (-) Transcript_36879:180-2012(-)
MKEKVGGSVKEQVDHILFVSRLPGTLAIVGNTIATPDSYDLAVRLGAGPAFSGSIVGSVSTGFFVGTTCIWLVGRRWPYFWRDVPRLIQFVGVVMGFLGSALYITVSVAAGHATKLPEMLLGNGLHGSDGASDIGQGSSVAVLDPPQLLGLTAGALQVVLVTGQVLQGTSVACFMSVAAQLIANIADPDDRPHYSGMLTEYSLMGLGSGPVVAAGAHAFCSVAWGSGTRMFLAVGVAKIFFCVAVGVLVSAQGLPDLSGFKPDQQISAGKLEAEADGEGKPLKNISAQDLAEQACAGPDTPEDSAAQTAPVSRLPPCHNILRICGVLLTANLLHFMASGLEVVSVMVLEVEFGWNAARAGFVVGITFLCGLPLRRLLMRAKGEGASEAKTAGLIRWLLVITAGSCVLLFRQWCRLFGSSALGQFACVAFLLLADLLFYSSVMFAQSMVRGIAMQCVQAPGEGPFDFTNFWMGWAIMVDLVSRTSGPPLARARLSSAAGRDGYAVQQLLVLSLAWLCAEAMVLRRRADGSRGFCKNSNSAASDQSLGQIPENANDDSQDEIQMLQDIDEGFAETDLSAKQRDPAIMQSKDMPPAMIVGKVLPFSGPPHADV